MAAARPDFLMILGIGVHTPEIVLFAVHKISNSQYGRQHGMVLIVVPMQSISADGLKISHRGKKGTNRVQCVTIRRVIHRVCFGDPKDATIFDVGRARDSDALHLLLSQFHQLTI
jgi:hypothetical protein